MKVESECPQRRSIRLRGHEYSQRGAYFIILCTPKRLYFMMDGEDAVERGTGTIDPGFIPAANRSMHCHAQLHSRHHRFRRAAPVTIPYLRCRYRMWCIGSKP